MNIQQLETQSPSPFIEQKTPTTVEHVKPITVPGIDILLRASLFTVTACHRLGNGLIQKTNPIIRAALAIISYITSNSINITIYKLLILIIFFLINTFNY